MLLTSGEISCTLEFFTQFSSLFHISIMDDFFDAVSHHITERMVCIFCIGIIVGMCSSIVSKLLQEHFPLVRAHATSSAVSNGCKEISDSCYQKISVAAVPFKFNGTGDDTHVLTDVPAYIVVSPVTKELLYGKDIDTPRQVASLTKLMTAVIAVDLLSPGEILTVTHNAMVQVPTNLGMQEGEKLTLHELLSSILLTSANDGAEVFMDHIDAIYGSGTFIAAMNLKAEKIGMTNTHFDNPQGFDSNNNYSTARDLAVLGSYIYTQYPDITEIATHAYVLLEKNSSHHQFDLYNWNGLLGVYPGINGLKTGNTPDAGKTAIYTAERGGNPILIVVLGAQSSEKRDEVSVELFNNAFERSQSLLGITILSSQLREKYLTWPTRK